MNELINHIRAENARMVAWQKEDPKNRMVFITTDEPEHWVRYGITTVDAYERYNLKMEIWDLYKEVNGFRPRWVKFDELSREDLESFRDRLVEEARETYAAEEAYRKAEEAAEAAAMALVGAESFLPNPVWA